MFYIANWGGTRLAFRFPKALINLQANDRYCDEEQITLSESQDFAILDINVHEEEGYNDWIEGEYWLPSLVRFRESILKEDYRVLYLAWLKYSSECSYDLDVEAEEPPVPAGLNKLTPALKDFIEIFKANKDLLKVAVQTSEKLKPTPDLSKEIHKLSREDCEYFLIQVLKGKPNIDMVLRQKLSNRRI